MPCLARPRQALPGLFWPVCQGCGLVGRSVAGEGRWSVSRHHRALCGSHKQQLLTISAVSSSILRLAGPRPGSWGAQGIPLDSPGETQRSGCPRGPKKGSIGALVPNRQHHTYILRLVCGSRAKGHELDLVDSDQSGPLFETLGIPRLPGIPVSDGFRHGRHKKGSLYRALSIPLWNP